MLEVVPGITVGVGGTGVLVAVAGTGVFVTIDVGVDVGVGATFELKSTLATLEDLHVAVVDGDEDGDGPAVLRVLLQTHPELPVVLRRTTRERRAELSRAGVRVVHAYADGDSFGDTAARVREALASGARSLRRGASR